MPATPGTEAGEAKEAHRVHVRQALQAAFFALDFDGDDRISKEEMSELMEVFA